MFIFLTSALPGAPRDVKFNTTLNHESSSVAVEWVTPSVTGGVSKGDLKFVIKYCESSDNTKCEEIVTEAGSTKAVVKDLKANTKYRFEVSARASETSKGKTTVANYKTLSKGNKTILCIRLFLKEKV